MGGLEEDSNEPYSKQIGYIIKLALSMIVTLCWFAHIPSRFSL